MHESDLHSEEEMGGGGNSGATSDAEKIKDDDFKGEGKKERKMMTETISETPENGQSSFGRSDRLDSLRRPCFVFYNASLL